MYGIITDQPEQNSHILKLFAGLLEPDEGSLLFDGKDISSSFQTKQRAIRKQIGFVFQTGGLLSNLNVLENFLVPYDFHYPEISFDEKKEKIVYFMEAFKLSENILSERPAKLTISTRKALLFIRTYLTEPKIIFYDEPFIDCSLQIKKTMLDLMLKSNEKNVIQIFCSSVDAQLHELADVVLILKQGELISSAPFYDLKNSHSDFVTGLISNLLEG